MKIHLIAFTHKGHALENKIEEYLITQQHEVLTYRGSGKQKKPLDEFAREGFLQGDMGADALIYIGASGIAVRSIAPYVRSKMTDPAIVVIDDCGQFVVPLLSGHIGGANALANELADFLEAISVVTTATDNNEVFAIDTWANNMGLKILNPEKIKKVSAKLLSGKKIRIGTDYAVAGILPEGITIVGSEEECDVLITTSNQLLETRIECFQLIPQIHTIGLGCRKNADYDKLKCFVSDKLEHYDISKHSVIRIASIDVKKEEAAICQLSKTLDIPYHTYSAQDLNLVDGKFEESEFVKNIVGTDNVCERSAVAATELQGGKLIIKKVKLEGKTFAVARIDYIVRF